jgi:Fe-S-cluster containining protein
MPHDAAVDHTLLSTDDRLPLTCSRAGTCCHGKAIWLNPWELACLAEAAGKPVTVLRDEATCDGGIRLRMDGAERWRNLSACHFYAAGQGCSLHGARPLACRLFPLGRMRQGDEVRYVHEGRAFPCLDGCPEVRDLPTMTVGDYLTGQATTAWEAVADAYLDVMQDLADGALVLLLDSGLAASGDRATLPRWRKLGGQDHAARAAGLPSAWFDRLTAPGLPVDDSGAFVSAHRDLLQDHAQTSFARLSTPEALHDAACLMMALSLHLGRALGIDTVTLATRWIAVAKEHGAKE